jgi:hypothetical protein
MGPARLPAATPKGNSKPHSQLSVLLHNAGAQVIPSVTDGVQRKAAGSRVCT